MLAQIEKGWRNWGRAPENRLARKYQTWGHLCETLQIQAEIS
jgi:hypothetical protein